MQNWVIINFKGKIKIFSSKKLLKLTVNNAIISFVPIIAGLCNGSTNASGAFCQGSNPCPAAKTLVTLWLQGFYVMFRVASWAYILLE